MRSVSAILSIIVSRYSREAYCAYAFAIDCSVTACVAIRHCSTVVPCSETARLHSSSCWVLIAPVDKRISPISLFMIRFFPVCAYKDGATISSMSALYQGHIATTPIFFFTQKLSMLNKRLDRYKNNARGAMNTRKLLTIPRMQLLVSILALPVASGMYAKQSPGFMSPTQVASMQREREMAPIDKIELAQA